MKPQNLLTDNVTDDCRSLPRFQMSGSCGLLRRWISFLPAPHRLPEILHLHQRQTTSVQLRWGLRLQRRHWRLRWHRERHQLVSTTCIYDYVESSSTPFTGFVRVPGVWGSQIIRQSAHEGGKVVSLTHWPPLPPPLSKEIFLVLISARGWVDPRAIGRPEGICQWKIPMTTIGNRTCDLPVFWRSASTNCATACHRV